MYQALTEFARRGRSPAIEEVKNQILSHARAGKPYIAACHSQSCAETAQAIHEALAETPADQARIKRTTGILTFGGFTTDASWPAGVFREDVVDANDPVPVIPDVLDVRKPFEQLEGTLRALFGGLRTRDHDLLASYLGEHLDEAKEKLALLEALACSGAATTSTTSSSTTTTTTSTSTTSTTLPCGSFVATMAADSQVHCADPATDAATLKATGTAVVLSLPAGDYCVVYSGNCAADAPAMSCNWTLSGASGLRLDYGGGSVLGLPDVAGGAGCPTSRFADQATCIAGYEAAPPGFTISHGGGDLLLWDPDTFCSNNAGGVTYDVFQ
jgi:hypothetical protein